MSAGAANAICARKRAPGQLCQAAGALFFSPVLSWLLSSLLSPPSLLSSSLRASVGPLQSANSQEMDLRSQEKPAEGGRTQRGELPSVRAGRQAGSRMHARWSAQAPPACRSCPSASLHSQSLHIQVNSKAVVCAGRGGKGVRCSPVMASSAVVEKSMSPRLHVGHSARRAGRAEARRSGSGRRRQRKVGTGVGVSGEVVGASDKHDAC